ncbi:NucA/NucB deoxyribonuclease domain-containing protein [Streptomyces niveus]|uniref:NucA/NucB deoxyribonuclease domain-containing protein n=1 Tax=Streptomyces niveus TaxID=193462 RepID=UPI003673E5B3
MTWEECRDGLGTENRVYVKSRFAVCSGASFTQIWSRNGQPAGSSFFNLRVVGTIPLNSRTITYTYHYTDLGTVGTTGAAAMGITTAATIPFISPSTAKTTQGGTVMPSTRTFAQLAASGKFAQTQTAAAGQGSNGTTDTVFGVYQPSVKIKPPAGYTLTGNLEGSPFMFAPRWDKAPYLNSFATGGAVFSMITPMLYSKAADAPERAVALHIEKAFKTPGLTQPPSSTKKVPGQTTDAPLTRLYQDRKRRDDNRAQAVNACRRHFGPDYTAGGKDCDEYPFATTYEGAAGSLYDPEQLRDNYSVMALDSTQNQAAGTLLGQFLTKSRLIDGPDDGFLVQIVP